MIYVPPTTEYEGNQPSVFLAGGIFGCEAWQQRMTELLAGSNLVVFNPRRAVFPTKDFDADREQIGWEYRHLRRATARLFWFPAQTLCPIALFELGVWTRTNEPLFVGMNPAYGRRFDLETQLGLARPDVTPVYELNDLADQILTWEETL